MDDERDYVMLGGEYARLDALGTDFTPIDDEALLAEISRAVVEHPGYLPVDQWRVVHGTKDEVVVASDGRCDWGGWAVLKLERVGSQWRHVGGISFNQELRPTPQAKGRGLQLAFVQETFETRAGEDIQLAARLANVSSERIERSLAWCAIASIEGTPAVREINITLQARIYQLDPDESAVIPVVHGVDVSQLSPGDYPLAATMPWTGLAATDAVLRVLPPR